MTKSKLLILLVCVVLGVGLCVYYLTKNDETQIQDITPVSEQEAEDQPQTEVKYLTLTGDEYKKLFLDSSHPNTKVIVEAPEITSDATLDARIVDLAEARGYELQEVPSSELNEYEGAQLQQKLAEAWAELKKLAASEGIQLEIESGLRTVEDQRQLFLEKLGGSTTDAQIDQVLATTAPPGYSRHHSGYVFDLADTSAIVFEYSDGYKWISADNYLVVKKLGIIPSYPDGAKNQGPEPEPWEYVWVGQQLLIE